MSLKQKIRQKAIRITPEVYQGLRKFGKDVWFVESSDVITVLDEVTQQIQERIEKEETVAKDYYGTFESELGFVHEYGAKVLREVLAVLDGENKKVNSK